MLINKNRPRAIAKIGGSEAYPEISGIVRFFDRGGMVLLIAELSGLPENDSGFFAFHIHSGEECSGVDFANTGSHYNPSSSPHPLHSGDLPPILSAHGKGYLALLSDRFSINEIIGKTVVIHKNADDFTTQPAGNSGEKIACGKILINK